MMILLHPASFLTQTLGPLSRHQQNIFRRFTSGAVHTTCTARATTNNRPRSATRCRDTLKRKVALVVGYDGATYHGFQRNPDVSTVSDILEQSLHEAGCISDENVGFLDKIKWKVAARTDRGVCAAGNVISAKLLFKKEEYLNGTAHDMTTARVNALLPDHVRLFGIRSVTGSFSPRANCEARWYEYILPMTALPESSSLENFAEILGKLEGTHRFHNYTVGVDHAIPPRRQAIRFITEATCDPRPIQLPGKHTSDIQWVRIRIKGQSFMLHQIRKMVSMAVLTYHGWIPSDAIGRSFSRQVLIDVPPAPAAGLFLDRCQFANYNKRHEKSLAEPLSLDDFDRIREEFKFRYIYPSVALRHLYDGGFEHFFKTAEAYPPRFPDLTS